MFRKKQRKPLKRQRRSPIPPRFPLLLWRKNGSWISGIARLAIVTYIGQWYANEYAQEDFPEAIADVMKAVRDSQEKIAALQAEREKAETEEAIAAEEGKVCPVCGKISDARFCPHCGAPLVEAHQASKEEIAAQQEAESQAAGEEA